MVEKKMDGNYYYLSLLKAVCKRFRAMSHPLILVKKLCVSEGSV